MRKFFLLLPLAALALASTSCSYDDDDIWSAVNDVTDRVDKLEQASNDMSADIAAIQTIVRALQQNLSITAVTDTANGYKITFSDGSEATISNGVDGVSAPEISIKKDSDGYYYWTIDGQWLMADGQKVRASATDGQDAVAPQVRINPTTNEWEISTDGGISWASTGISAKGDNGESLFSNVDTNNSDYVTFTLTDGTTLQIPRYDSTSALFSVQNCEGTQVIRNGQSKSYKVETANIASYTIQKPDGWRAAFESNTLTITAPVAENTYAEQDGDVSIVVLSTAGKSMIVKIPVATYEMRILTFEDADAKFDAYPLSYASKTINTWSDLIDNKQYGGTLLYGTSGYGMDEPYYWYDQNNTELMHIMPSSYGSYCYWGGGHAVSNYATTNLSEGDFTHQLSVYGQGGHNGSANFAMHYGYIDGSSFNMTSELPALSFYDGTERMIDHMWVMNSNYAMNSYVSGNGLTAKIGPDDWVKLIAIGYDASDNKVGETSIYMCNGPDNIVRDWTKWDLSSLGKVAKIEFNITGSSDNGYGFSQPAYFAYDDVAVIF
ncbi:MAG: DUF4988 and DUF4465 domain-containing protein [Bacteroides sp.]|nr:DUF4988 and DUF4465 domain-containing protein [Bacteroides sp.]MCM1412893.1 DUF4988 and DUF4465 domain-containing protein [Bacteroides sp.]MCM1471562.1 DUF4988 and DUF4465 domain-containing protein [Bacteroides sp.]